MFLFKEKTKFFIEHNFRIYVSIDGPRRLHDHLRGANTFDVIMQNLTEIKKIYPSLDIEILCTYTKFHQDNISLEKLNDFFESLNYPYSINGVDTNDISLKIVEEKPFIEREQNFIDTSIVRILSNSSNIGISYYLTAVLDALLFKNQQKYFCKELANNYSNVFDFNGDEYNCIRLFGTYKKDDEKLVKFNQKSFEQCKNCWCKNFCNLCVAEIILGVNEYPFIGNSECKNRQLYDYALYKVVYLYNGDTEVFQKLVKNYCQKYLK